MPNDFSTNPYCKAHWKMNNGVYTLDSKGGNTLTPVGSPANDTTNKMEGDASLLLNGTNGLAISDANLCSGFPLKSGGTGAPAGTFGFWFRQSTVTYSSDRWLLTKGVGWLNQFSFGIDIYNRQLNVMTTANGSTRQNQISNGYTFTTGRWYFLTLGFNNTYNWFRFMAWDSVANSFVYTRSNVIAGGSIYVGPGNFNICGWTGYVGNIDEVVVLDYCANMEEVKDIIDQSYPVARNNVASDPACKAYYSFPWPYPHEPTIGPWLDPLNQYQVAYPSEVADKAGYCDARVLTTDYYYGYSVETENQPTGWPFKPGESTRVGTFCIWFKPQIGQADATLVGHWMEGTIPYRSWCILPGDSTQNCRVKLAHSSTAYETQDTGWRPTDNQYYLYMVAIDGTTNKTVRIKIWGKTENAVVYSGTLDFANKTQLYLGHTTWPFFVGATVPYSWFRPAGWIGSLAVFNRLLSDAEMDAYIAGTFVFASAPADCRSATDCEALLPVPDGIWSETTCEDVHDLTPDDARSLTTCEGVLVSLEECVSLSTCEDITLPRPDDCRSITYCPITAGGQPNAAISLTRCQALPLTYGEGTFMVF